MLKHLKNGYYSLKRYHQKWRIKFMVRRLPVEMRSEVLYALYEILDFPERRGKVQKVRGIFDTLRKGINDPCREKIAGCRAEVLDEIEQAAENVLAPDFPLPRISIDHTLLEEKTKARITLLGLEERIEGIPHTKKSFLYLACLGLLFSAFSNFWTFSMLLGTDWIGGNEILTTLVNGLISLLFMIFEIIGLYLFLHFTPKKYSSGLARLFGLIGAAILVLSIVSMVLSRTEIGSQFMPSAQGIGKVQ